MCGCLQHRHRLTLAMAIIALLLSVMPPGSAQASSIQWAALDRTLAVIAPQSNLMVAEFAGNSCRSIHARNESSMLAIASTFKLYVLGELARQVQLGQVGWDDRVTLVDNLRSMPSGDYAWARAGTWATTRQLAEAMIWQSDNTATDHLIDFLGRENVERSFAAFGHSDPSSNVPLLLTRELFGIKMTQSAGWMDRYVAATELEQRMMVEREIGPMRINPDGGWGLWNGPTAIDGIEWFASAQDLCRVTVGLWTLGAQPGLEPVRVILTGNRGGVWDASAWPRAGYKGGYEAGVVNMTWVLERSDGRVFFVSAGYNMDRGIVDQSTARGALEPVFACLGTVDGGGACAPPRSVR